MASEVVDTRACSLESRLEILKLSETPIEGGTGSPRQAQPSWAPRRPHRHDEERIVGGKLASFVAWYAVELV